MTTQSGIRSVNFPATFFATKERAVSGLRLFTRGEQIYRPGDVADFVYFIADGKVKISTPDEAGQETMNGILSGGDIFGEKAMAGEEFRCDTASALENTTIRVLSIRDMLLLLNGRNDLTALLMQRIAGN